MKKVLFTLLMMLAFTGMALAQDVYSSGFYYNSDGEKVAVVYKNGDLLYSTGNTPSYNHESPGVLYLEGDVYWVDDCIDSNGDYYYSKVMKNDQVFLDIPVGSEPYITCLFTDGTDVYAGGYMRIGGYHNPIIWKNNVSTPYLNFIESDYLYGYIQDAMIVEGSIIACGYVFDNNIPGHVGVVWHQASGQLYSFGDVIVHSIDYYNGDIYTAIYDIGNQIGAVYQNDNELYTLTEQGGSNVVCVDAGDIYADTYDRVENYGSIWKNGEKLYDLSHFSSAHCMVANSEGVFFPDGGRIRKNNLVLYSLGFENAPTVQDMFVDLSCKNNNARTLPYYESFETGSTDWKCWWSVDLDEQNDGYASYWDRVGERIITSPAGQNCARHRFNSEYQQEGVLVTPLLSIPEGGNVTMTFKTFEEYPSDYGYEGVWVVEGGHKALGDEVWTQTEPSGEWKTVTIDLSAYQGKDVEIDFRYSGANAHSWFIDDIVITSDYQPCPTVTAPYVEHFDTGLDECMYVLDADHDGTCWQWNAMYQAAIHPRGVNNSQEGGLFTPRIALSADKLYQLKFDFRTILPKGESWKSVEYSVWMTVDGNGLNNLEDFNEIWRKSLITATNESETVNIDLTPYSGHTVQFAFSYEGYDAFMWLLENIEVTEKTGVDENGGDGLAIYPNPASDRIRIEGLEGKSEVQIYNTLGELVMTMKADGDNEIDIAELASGLYLVRCGEATMRFVKE